MNDLVGFIVALAALTVRSNPNQITSFFWHILLTRLKISERSSSPRDLSFGWQRARLLGAFFNGVFLLALGISIFLQSIERFVSLQRQLLPVRFFFSKACAY